MGLTVDEALNPLRTIVDRLGSAASINRCMAAMAEQGLEISRTTLSRALRILKDEHRRAFALRDLGNHAKATSDLADRAAPVMSAEEQVEIRARVRSGVSSLMSIIEHAAEQIEITKPAEVLPVAQAAHLLVQSILAIDAAETQTQHSKAAQEREKEQMIDVTPIPRTASGLTPLQDALKKMREERERNSL